MFLWTGTVDAMGMYSTCAFQSKYDLSSGAQWWQYANGRYTYGGNSSNYLISSWNATGFVYTSPHSNNRVYWFAFE